MNLDIVSELERMAQDKGVKAAQLALAWVLAQGEDIVPIPGTSRRANLKTNIEAANIILSPHELNELNTLASKIKGTRYSEQSMRMTNL